MSSTIHAYVLVPGTAARRHR